MTQANEAHNDMIWLNQLLYISPHRLASEELVSSVHSDSDNINWRGKRGRNRSPVNDIIVLPNLQQFFLANSANLDVILSILSVPTLSVPSWSIIDKAGIGEMGNWQSEK